MGDNADRSMNRNLLSIGAFCIIVVVSLLLFAVNLIGWTLILPLILALSGVWLLVVAGMRMQNPQKYERGAFNTLSMGLILLAIGGAWFVYGYGWVYSIVVLLLVLAALALAAATRRK